MYIWLICQMMALIYVFIEFQFSAKYLMNRCKISRKTINRWESPELLFRPPTNTLQRIFPVSRIWPTWFIWGGSHFSGIGIGWRNTLHTVALATVWTMYKPATPLLLRPVRDLLYQNLMRFCINYYYLSWHHSVLSHLNCIAINCSCISKL